MTRLRQAHAAVRAALELRRQHSDGVTQATQALFAADQEYARAKAMHAMDCPALDDVEAACDCEPVESDARTTVRSPDL
jgi:hypothetical protein